MVLNRRRARAFLLDDLRRGEWKNAKSLLFDGVDETINLGNVLDQGSGNFSFSFWFKTNMASGVWNWITKRAGAGIGSTNGFFIGTLNWNWAFTFLDSTGGNYVQMVLVQNYGDGAWHHIVVSWNNGTQALAMVIDSVPKLNNNVSGVVTTVTNTQDMVFGNNFNGNMDEIVMYNKALSLVEAQAIHNGGTPIDPSTLPTWANAIGYWRMGDGDFFPKVKDKIAGNDGDMVNLEVGDIVQDVP